MDASEWNRRTWAMTLRRFLELAWTRHGFTRYASVAILPFVVALSVPGLWWLWCAAGAIIGMYIDLRLHQQLVKTAPLLDRWSEDQLKAAAQQQIWVVSVLTSAYCAPYAFLVFSPGPGPLIGLLYLAGAALVIASLHVMTPTMIFYTAPVIAVGLIANAAVLAPPGYEIAAAALAIAVVVNMLVMARAGGTSFGDLIAARLGAELAAENLDRRVQARTAELEEAMRVAEAANKAKMMFLANMSHELRTPLNAVIGYSEIIEEDLEAGDVSECAQHIDRVHASAVHLLGLISDVLDFTKAESDKIELRPEDVSTRELAEAVLNAVAPVAAGKGSVCELVIDSGAERLNADPLRVKQCLMNLASNAAKFTPNGRITLHVRRSVWNGAAAVSFDVCDTGIGISAETLAQLFQPFVQADASITREYGGTGLGLSITRKYARLMGGDVAVESQPGRGSRFTLTLPMAAEAGLRGEAA